MYSREKEDMVLKAHNISSPEFYVFCKLGYRIPLTKEEIAREMPGEARVELMHEYGKAYPNTPEKCEKIVDQCIEKGWIRILSAEDIASQEAFVEEIDISKDFFDFIELEGCLDFTLAGYQLYLKLSNELHWRPRKVDHDYLRFFEINR